VIVEWFVGPNGETIYPIFAEVELSPQRQKPAQKKANKHNRKLPKRPQLELIDVPTSSNSSSDRLIDSTASGGGISNSSDPVSDSKASGGGTCSLSSRKKPRKSKVVTRSE
jgi:hypothetical protein